MALTSVASLKAQSVKKMLTATKWGISLESIAPKAELEKMGEEQKKNMKETLAKSYYLFKEDGTMEVMMGGKAEEGTWVLSEDGKKLTTTKANGEKMVAAIVEFDEKNLVLKPEEGSTQKMMPVLTFHAKE